MGANPPSSAYPSLNPQGYFRRPTMGPVVAGLEKPLTGGSSLSPLVDSFIKRQAEESGSAVLRAYTRIELTQVERDQIEKIREYRIYLAGLDPETQAVLAGKKKIEDFPNKKQELEAKLKEAREQAQIVFGYHVLDPETKELSEPLLNYHIKLSLAISDSDLNRAETLALVIDSLKQARIEREEKIIEDLLKSLESSLRLAASQN